MSQPAKKLKPEVARKYVIGTHHTRFIHAKHGEIDLTELSLKEADELVQSGVLKAYLVPKRKASRKKKV
jgi:hypothetical protein